MMAFSSLLEIDDVSIGTDRFETVGVPNSLEWEVALSVGAIVVPRANLLHVSCHNAEARVAWQGII